MSSRQPAPADIAIKDQLRRIEGLNVLPAVVGRSTMPSSPPVLDTPDPRAAAPLAIGALWSSSPSLPLRPAQEKPPPTLPRWKSLHPTLPVGAHHGQLGLLQHHLGVNRIGIEALISARHRPSAVNIQGFCGIAALNLTS